ncbi:MAG: type II secretion system protein [Planctomycetota bacterium]|jgi:prepilin-type N-terminal cleavage/methylation domain-containing protein
MKRTQAGFSFIEILVVMGIIVVLVGMVAVVVPRAQEARKRTVSINNVRNMVQLMTARNANGKPWPPYDGKNFVLSLVAYGEVDRRNPDNLTVFFSPGDGLYTLEKATPERYTEITKAALKQGTDFHELTSYAGRRNLDRDYQITPDRESMGVPIVCDDDDGALHHPQGLVIGYTNGSVKFVEWEDMDMLEPEDKNNPEPFLGERAEVELLRGLSSE